MTITAYPALVSADAPVSERERRYILLAPLVLIGCCAASLPAPFTRRVFYWAVSENRPVEVMTFLVALVASVQGVRLAVAQHRAGRARWVVAVELLFACGMAFIAGEEIAWGQQFIGFRTPESLASLNRQGELTLHNLGPMQGHNDALRVSFGIGGLIGIALGRRARLRPVCPPAVLASWFAVIIVVGLLDTVCDVSGLTRRGWEFGHRLSEVVEFLIAMAGLLHVELRRRQRAAFVVA